MSNREIDLRGPAQSRRGFVKAAGVALAGAGVAAFGLAGCAPQAPDSGKVDASADGTWWWARASPDMRRR